ncbi:MAG: hypothetical protein BroJett013_25210 [Alphaproteobacteria bacterium]|nr:MAG: hypothetical protein BroJett013_25210 [Alphaproteobacteria bacterium]
MVQRLSRSWLAIFAVFPQHRRIMLWASLFTAPFGLTEPLFVPEYWSPPSLFDLARRTGFDIESIIFSFGLGGIGAVLYNLLTGNSSGSLADHERLSPRHRLHTAAILAPALAFPILAIFPLNPIFPAIGAMLLGAGAALLCRPDLVRKTWIGAALFIAYYAVFLAGLQLTAPGYIARVWQLNALTGLKIGGVPIEEFLFAAAFGAYWSGVYDHFTWRKPMPAPRRSAPLPTETARQPGVQRSHVNSSTSRSNFLDDGCDPLPARHRWAHARKRRALTTPLSRSHGKNAVHCTSLP